MEYYSLNQYLKDTFHTKVYKISINAGFTCPNRDGTLDTRGCIFCSGEGSGDFCESPLLSVSEQIELGKKRVEGKIGDNGKYTINIKFKDVADNFGDSAIVKVLPAKTRGYFASSFTDKLRKRLTRSRIG